MSTSNVIDITIPETVLTDVTTKLQEIKTALAPYIFPLTEEQRKFLPKMGDKTVAFVQKTLDYSATNPEYAPGYFDKTELSDDLAAAQVLAPLDGLAQQIANDINDTMMMAGSEAFTMSLVYYNAVKNAAKTGQASAKPIYDDLSQRFPGAVKKTKVIK